MTICKFPSNNCMSFLLLYGFSIPVLGCSEVEIEPREDEKILLQSETECGWLMDGSYDCIDYYN